MALTQVQKTNLRAALVADADGIGYLALLPPTLPLDAAGAPADLQGLVALINQPDAAFSIDETELDAAVLRQLIEGAEVDAIVTRVGGDGQTRWDWLRWQLASDNTVNIGTATSLRAGLLVVLNTTDAPNSRTAIAAALTRPASEFEAETGVPGIDATKRDVFEIWRDG